MESVSAPASAGENPFAEAPEQKNSRLLAELNQLTAYHAANCLPYRRIVDVVYGGRTDFDSLEQLPFVPVRLFKEVDLLSVPRSEVMKTLLSSGTSGQRPSRIFLDKQTALAQSRALVRIARSYLGPKRLPMLIIDHAGVMSDRSSFSARVAGVIGFSQFGSDQTYALRSGTMEADWDAIGAFLQRHRGETVFLFGFTFIVWQYFLRAAESKGLSFDFGDSILIHGGGWKKLADERISNDEFKSRLRSRFGIRRVHNYYGMVEQTGSIYMECDSGYFHAPDYSDIIIRSPRTLRELPPGSPGLITTLSSIPRSYPGHVLLTEDIGTVAGRDGCACLRRGTFFTISGRLPKSELRGCSDTHQVVNG